MRKPKKPKPKRTIQYAIALGVVIVAVTILVSYYMDQSRLAGQRFGDQLAQIQTDLKNETDGFDAKLTLYKAGQITQDSMLNITDSHLTKVQEILSRYDELKAPDIFAPSLQLFRLSTQTEIESDKYLREWVLTGDNSSMAKSDELLQQSFQYEMSALKSYGTAKSKGSQ